MSRRLASGSSRAWRRTRAAVLQRDGHRCRLRFDGVCTTRATHVHHTQPRELVGDNPRPPGRRVCTGNLGRDPVRHDPALTAVRPVVSGHCRYIGEPV